MHPTDLLLAAPSLFIARGALDVMLALAVFIVLVAAGALYFSRDDVAMNDDQD